MGARGVGDRFRLRCGAGLTKLAAIVELHAAETTMIELAAAETAQEVPETVLHAVDLVPFFQLHQTSSPATGTAAFVTHAVREARNELLHGTIAATVDCQAFEALPLIPVRPLH